MQQGDYGSYYQYPNPNPNPNPDPIIDHRHQSPYASAPPFTSSYSPPDYSGYPSNYHPPYPQNPDPAPTPTPTAPAYTPPTNLQQPSFNPPQPSFPPYDSLGPYQPPSSTQPPPYFPPFDHHQPPPNYSSSSVPPPRPLPSYDPNPYESSVKFDHGGSYFDGGYSRGRPDYGSDFYGDGVYAYEGGKVEPYGARGTAPKSSSLSTLFDDYGRSISSSPSRKDYSSVGSGSGKIVKAVPKAEVHEDVKSGVQKFRVKLLAESGGQSTMDVLCQIGLDGIRMLDPNTNRTLRIYPLENITRCDKTDSSTFAFWSKSPVDIEPRRIRLQSNSYTTNTLLDTVTAATVQLKEMGESIKPPVSSKINEHTTEKKKGLTDWMNLIKPGNEEKDHWVPDEAVSKCTACGTDFGAFNRRHHCRNCGDIFCDKCTHGRIALTADENAQPVRVCDRCMAEVTQRLSNAKEAANKPAALQSHEDLAKKLQEEMERNRKASVSKSDGSGRRMREVACPTCTVHLQVQVPSSGSETVECGVCQQPFLVSAH
ncbi:Protein free1 [Turnera subulata]|uniref:Protein free1 n=1 Tax=Turnera subulata TaxID=218843 RepID=A0A9Q0F1Q4_9ROSI|nr:Protein free1 [Turnera subulata]